jgi:hypothetical protein
MVAGLIVLNALEKSIKSALTLCLAFLSRCLVTVSNRDINASSVDFLG